MAQMPPATGLRASGTLIRAGSTTANPQPVNVLKAIFGFHGGIPCVEARQKGCWRSVELACSRVSRRPAAFRPSGSRRKGRGRARTLEQVSPPDGSPAELLRTTPPHSLAPSDTINRCVGVQPPENKTDESIRETSDKPRARRSSRCAAQTYLSAPAIRDTCNRLCKCPFHRS
jgi:hypothetical protein